MLGRAVTEKALNAFSRKDRRLKMELMTYFRDLILMARECID
jgi:hypothetical protein